MALQAKHAPHSDAKISFQKGLLSPLQMQVLHKFLWYTSTSIYHQETHIDEQLPLQGTTTDTFLQSRGSLWPSNIIGRSFIERNYHLLYCSWIAYHSSICFASANFANQLLSHYFHVVKNVFLAFLCTYLNLSSHFSHNSTYTPFPATIL